MALSSSQATPGNWVRVNAQAARKPIKIAITIAIQATKAVLAITRQLSNRSW
jgi:hypothetical protein